MVFFKSNATGSHYSGTGDRTRVFNSNVVPQDDAPEDRRNNHEYEQKGTADASCEENLDEFTQHGRLPRTSRHLVIGAGQLGKALHRALTNARYPVRLLTRNEYQLENAGHLADVLSHETFDVVWLTAAATAVDWCESHRREAFEANATAPGEIAAICAHSNLKLIHFSTDYVFSGIENGRDRSEPYLETDDTSPLSVYGESKRDGEMNVIDTCTEATIVRTSGLYSVDGKCFFNAILDRGLKGEDVDVVDDQITSPTNVEVLADWLSEHFRQLPRGVIHVAASGGVSWRRAAEVAFEFCGLPRRKVRGTTSLELGRPARRPGFSVLSSKVMQELALNGLPNWIDGLSRWALDKTKNQKS